MLKIAKKATLEYWVFFAEFKIKKSAEIAKKTSSKILGLLCRI
jgi:hypothetical protein